LGRTRNVRPHLLSKPVRAAETAADWGSLAMSENSGTYDFGEENSLQIVMREIVLLLGLGPEIFLEGRRTDKAYRLVEENEQKWSQRNTFLFVIISSILGWSAILFFIYRIAT
jgi:hypothetical protein